MNNNLRAEMSRNGYTQKVIAEKLNISMSRFNNKIRGASGFTAEEILAMSKLFNVSADYLLEIENGC